MRKIKLFLLFLIIFMLSISSISAKVQNVDNEMRYASYWINHEVDTDKIIMTSAQIADYNDQLLKNSKTMNDLDDLGDYLSEYQISSFIDSRIVSGSYYINGGGVNYNYWQNLNNNLDLTDLKDSNDIKYGVCVKRSNIRNMPTSDVASTDTSMTKDLFQISEIKYNDSVAVINTSADGDWYFIITKYCTGWVNKKSIALYETKDDWENSLNYKYGFVVVDEKYANIYKEKTKFDIGTKFEIGNGTALKGFYSVVKLYRGNNGVVKKRFVHIKKSFLHKGYLDYTNANLIELAFKLQNQKYSWRGRDNGTDSAGYVRELYACFGFNLERDAAGMEKMIGDDTSLYGLGSYSKGIAFHKMKMGTLLFMNDHVMIFLGIFDEKFYVIHDLDNYYDSVTGKTVETGKIMVNELTLSNQTYGTFLNSLTSSKFISS